MSFLKVNLLETHVCRALLSKTRRGIGGIGLGLLLALGVATVHPVQPLFAQTGGEAGIQGTVVDSTGAAIPGATVTATNDATGVSTTRQTSGSGLYTISPIIPGTYTVTVKATGFQTSTQKNFSIDALKLTGLNMALKLGESSTEITVDAAPPALETTNAVLGGVMENQTYAALPLQMNAQQRDPTAFATLLPGVQGGSRAPVIGGTGNFLAAVYVDGIPVTTINQNGDNRVVSNALPIESIDQFQVVTSTPAAEYQGAGLINFTLKSGGNNYHGEAVALFRNTALDSWTWASAGLTCTSATGVVSQCRKPVEHQLEFVGALGGQIPFTRKKGFFFVTYDKYHGRSGINPNTLTVPTVAMRGGDFSALLINTPTGCVTGTAGCVTTGRIYDPTTTAACTAANGGAPCRNPYPNNVIPSNELSPIALKMQAGLPLPTNSNTFNNYLGGVPSGFDNHEFTARLDFDLTKKQRLSYVLALGTRKNVPFTVGGTPAGVVLPLPYTAGGYAQITPKITDVEHVWTISNSIVNQFKFAFNRFAQPITALTDGAAPYRAAADLGITNLPAGQASTEFPGATFAATATFGTLESPWTSNGASGATQTTVPNTYTALDNLQVVKGKHNLTIGFQAQWLQDNVAAQLGPSGIYTIPYNANSTANFTGTSLSTTTTGFSYASFLLGAVPSSGVGLQAVAETGGRYHDLSPYVQDDWKVTPKLTLNLGLRWDYFPPFHEVQDRWSFLNPNIPNAATGNLGALQFAGNRGAGFSCQCRTPVQSWYKNYGPRIGLAYSLTPKTVLRAGYALVYSIGGGVGGRGGAGTGTGATGFNTSATTPAEQTSGVAAGPSYYLNNSSAFTALGIANTAYGGPTYVLPSLPTPSAASQTLNTGNYLNGSTYVTPSSVSFADPYLSGRAPEFSFFNAGIQQSITNDLTLTVNYAGTQSHFILPGGANARGYWTNQLDPKYLGLLGAVLGSDAKTPLLTSKATPANVAILQQKLPTYTLPYASFSAANATSTIAQGLVTFPQYSGVNDTWGSNVANISYNSLQVSVAQRMSHHVSYTLNYTWSKNIGDDGTFRSGYDLPSSATSNGLAYHQNRIDRGETLTNIQHNASFYGVYQSPFGKSGYMANNKVVSILAGGWEFSHIYTYVSGTPLVVTYAGCTSPNLGQCMPDLNPNYSGNGRKNGNYGAGLTTGTLGSKQYLDPNAFVAPGLYGTATNSLNKIGTAPRTAPYGLHAPGKYNLDIGLHRTFNITPERVRFVFEANGLNITNHDIKTNIATAWSPGSTTFGTFTGATANPRDFQFAGRVRF